MLSSGQQCVHLHTSTWLVTCGVITYGQEHFEYLSLGFVMGRLCVLDQLDSDACFGSNGNWPLLPPHLRGLFCSKSLFIHRVCLCLSPLHTLANQQAILNGCKLVTWCANSEFSGHHCAVVAESRLCPEKTIVISTQQMYYSPSMLS